MHIPDGVLSAPVLYGGAAAAAVGVGYGLWRMDYERIPRVAALSSAFFVASLVKVPLGPSSAHLVLCGLVGLILGWAAFPALLVALFLQAVFFQHGGVSTLGVNVIIMGLPAIACYYLFHRVVRRAGRTAATVAAFSSGALSIGLACLLWAACLYTAGEGFIPMILMGLGAHIPVMVIEGLLSVSAIVFLRRVRPELLSAPLLKGRIHAGQNPTS